MIQTTITNVRILNMGIDFAVMTVRSDWWRSPIPVTALPPAPSAPSGKSAEKKIVRPPRRRK